MHRPRRGLSSIVLLSIIGCFTVLLLVAVPVPTSDEEQTQTLEQAEEKSGSTPVTAAPQRADEEPITIVTCFFDLAKVGQKTKHPPSFYLEEGSKGTLAIKAPMIIFTDSPQDVQKYRAKYMSMTTIITMSIRDFKIASKHLDRTNELISRDSEASKYGYSGLLFIIYHCKPEMMAIAARNNPFNTSKFLYMDIGCIRNWGGIDSSDYQDKVFPRPHRRWLVGRDNRILMQGVAGNVASCPDNVRWVDPENPLATKDPDVKYDDPIEVPETPVSWWIGGAIFGGRGEDLLKYEELYALHLQRYLAHDKARMSLIDQYLMGALACHSNMVEVVQPPHKCCVDRVNRKWFFMLKFLMDEEYPQQPYSAAELAQRGGKVAGCMYC